MEERMSQLERLVDQFALAAGEAYWQNDQGWEQHVIDNANYESNAARVKLIEAIRDLLKERVL